MAKLGRIYEATDAGIQALAVPGSGLRADARLLLGLLSGQTHVEGIRMGMRGYSDERILALLAELEARRLIKWMAATENHDLDFTNPPGLSRV
jgi:hypothetical protein